MNVGRRWPYTREYWGLLGVVLLLLAGLFSSRQIYEAAAVLLASAFFVQLFLLLMDSTESRGLPGVVNLLLFPWTVFSCAALLLRSEGLLVGSAWGQGATESIYLTLSTVGFLQDRADKGNDSPNLSGAPTARKWIRLCDNGEFAKAFLLLIGTRTRGERSSAGDWLGEPARRLPGLPQWPVTLRIKSALVSLCRASEEWQRPPITGADPDLSKLVLVGLKSGTLSLADIAQKVRRAESMGADPTAPRLAATLERMGTAADQIAVAGHRASELGTSANDRSASALLGVSDLASVGDEVISLIAALEVVWTESDSE
jgi:hypothetical protein